MDIDQALHSAIAAQNAGNTRAAEQLYHEVLAVFPRHPVANHGLGLVYCELRDWTTGIRHLKRAIKSDPEDPAILGDYGNALSQVGQTRDGITFLKKALSADPSLVIAYLNLARAYLRRGDINPAIRLLESGRERDPGNVDIGGTLMGAYLLAGQYKSAWSADPWRFAGVSRRALPEKIPAWDGTPLGGRRLLLLAELGYGDVLLAARFVSRLDAADAEIVMTCQPALKDLLEQLPGVSEIITCKHTVVPETGADCYAPMMSLPGLLNVSGKDLWEGPYIAAPTDRVAAWSSRLAAEGKLRVGLVWSGNTGFHDNILRTIPTKTWSRLLDLPNVQFYSLQVGAELPEDTRIIDLGRQLSDWSDTAAALSQLDHLLTVDTGIAHLAGSMGLAATVMLSAERRDWRWGMEGKTTPWYPTLDLVRQTRPGDWNSVIKQVKRKLANI
jgi:Tfp pilus assembly protein PilF